VQNLRQKAWLRITLFLPLVGGTAFAQTVGGSSFLAEMHASMNRMMAGMDVPPTGDVDRDFVAMMKPHHQGAIDMAVAELRYGKNEQLRRIAQEIIVDQQQEIAAMDLALGRTPPPSAPVPTQQRPLTNGAPAPDHMHHQEH
jgi:hypothetical protein